MPLTAQTVRDVQTSFDQSRQLMIIKYDLPRLNHKKEVQILPFFILGNGEPVALQSITGDFGWLRSAGKNKHIIWDPFKDGVSSLDGLQITLKTEIRNAVIPRFWGVALQGSNSAPLGVKVMRLNRIGYFAGFRMGNLPPAYQYKVNNYGEINYLESGIYEIGSERILASYAITAGPVLQVNKIIYGYIGVGYGIEQLFWKYESFNLDRNPTGSKWALNENVDRRGSVAEIGAVLKLGRIFLDLGVSTIQLKTFQVIGGFGISFQQNKKGGLQ